MGIPVKLSEIIGEMEIQMNETSSYLNKNTGEVIGFKEEVLQAAEDEEPLEDYPKWQQEEL